MKKILITGGSGMIGTRLTKILEGRGHRVFHLSRGPRLPERGRAFLWNLATGELDEEALRGVSAIIHLAGENIGSGRWSERKKREIIGSRIGGLELLLEKLKGGSDPVKTLVSASAVGIYRKNREESLGEESELDRDFLGDTCKRWEDAAGSFSKLSIRVVKIRTGVVLSHKGGALPKMAAPVRFFVGSAVGKGSQLIPWIHLDDICGIYVKAIEDDSLLGAYNGVSPLPVSNRELTKALGKVLRRPLIMPEVPEFVVRMAFGELASLILDSQRVSAEKIMKAGFQFQYPGIDNALRNIFGSPKDNGGER